MTGRRHLQAVKIRARFGHLAPQRKPVDVCHRCGALEFALPCRLVAGCDKQRDWVELVAIHARGNAKALLALPGALRHVAGARQPPRALVPLPCYGVCVASRAR